MDLNVTLSLKNVTCSHSFGKLKIKLDHVSQDNLACIAIKILLHWIILTETPKYKFGNLYNMFFPYGAFCSHFLFLCL